MLVKTSTGYIKSPYNMGDCRILEDFLSIYDAENDRYIPYGYIVHDNAMYLPNIDIDRFIKPLDEKEVFNLPPIKYKPMSRHHMANVAPRDKQQEDAISFVCGTGMYKDNQNEHQLGVSLKTGGGKCIPLTTRIPVPGGYKHMGSLKVGDKVFDENGYPTKVVAIYDQKPSDIYQITLWDGRTAKCTLDHLWPVYIKGCKGYFIIPLSKIIENRSNWNDLALQVTVPTTHVTKKLCIKDIKLVDIGETRCIEVANPSHLFLTENFIVTHNTYTTSYSITQLNRKALIVTHMTKIKNQWVGTLTKLFDYRPDDMMELTTRNLDEAADGTDFKKDVYFISHQIINRWLTNQPPTKFNKALATLGIGIKVIDEYHLHWQNSLILDMFTNVDKTIYLTATFGRSNPDEDRLFRRVTINMQMFGTDQNMIKTTSTKHTIYHPITYTTRCPFKTVKAMGNGHGMGMKKWIYADWVHFNDPENTTNKIIFDLVEKCLSDEGKILITVASIKASEFMCQKLQSMYPDLIVAAINSTHSQRENDETKERARIITSTIQSAGTGVDIKGLRYLINAEPFSSKITAEQLLGRLRPYHNVDGDQMTTFMFDLVDQSILFCNIYYKSRSKKLLELAKETQPLSI